MIVGVFVGILKINGERRSCAAAERTTLSTLPGVGPGKRQRSCFMLRAGDLNAPEPPFSALTGDRTLLGRALRFFDIPASRPGGGGVFAEVKLFHPLDQEVLCSGLEEGKPDRHAPIWSPYELVRRDAYSTVIVPASLLRVTVVLVPHPQDWVNEQGISFVLPPNSYQLQPS